MFKVNGVELEIKKFPNGELNMQNFKDILLSSDFRREDGVELSWYFRSNEDFLSLLFIKRFLDDIKYKVDLVIKYLPYSRMDRVYDSPFTLKYVCDFINSLNFNRVKVLEVHSDVSLALLNNVEHEMINLELITDVMEDVDFDIDKDFVMFPDAGAQKRYQDMKFKNLLVGNKVRDFDSGRIEKVDVIGDLTEGSKVIIVDDLSSYGNTFLKAAEKLKDMGASDIYLLVAHSENSIFYGDLLKGKNLTKVFTTDSILTEHKLGANRDLYKNVLKVFKI